VPDPNDRIVNTLGPYLRKRQVLTLSSWKKQIKPLLRRAENDIFMQLRSYGLTEWQIFNLNNIKGRINNTIGKFETELLNIFPSQQDKIGQLAIKQIDRTALMAGLKIPPQAISADLLTALKPLSEFFLSIFSTDMARITGGEITLGLVQGESTQQVIQRLRQKFGIDSQQIARLENQKRSLDILKKQGKIPEETYNKQVQVINKKLSSGSNMSYARLERITETEMNRAESFAQNQRALEIKQIDPRAAQMWINAHKPGARVSHIATETQTRARPVPVGENFNVAGFPALFPRDPGLPVKEVVYCGCTLVMVLKK